VALAMTAFAAAFLFLVPARAFSYRVNAVPPPQPAGPALVFVHDAWFRRCVLGLTEPFTPMGLASPFVPDQEEQGLDRSSRPSLDEVLGVRERQASALAAWLGEVTPEQLAHTVPVPSDDGWPPYARGRSVRQCLGTVLNEEWAHHGFCVRDLDKLSSHEAPWLPGAS